MFGITANDKQLITETHQDVKWLMKAMVKMQTEAESEEGYKRCVAHKEKMISLTDDQEDLKKSFKWIRNTMVGGLVSTVVVGCAAAGNYLIGKT